MGGRSSRNKGASAERELFKILNDLLGRPIFKRNVTQTQDGGCDAVHAEDPNRMLPVALEVKRCETLALPAWIRQTLEQAKPGQMPVLAWRQSQQPWQVAVLMTPEQFAAYYAALPGSGVGPKPEPSMGVGDMPRMVERPIRQSIDDATDAEWKELARNAQRALEALKLAILK